MKLSKAQKGALGKLAQSNDLKFIVIYGSRVTGKVKADSDLDIAVFQDPKSKKNLKYSAIFDPLAEMFRQYDLDLGFLNKRDSLFLYEVTSNSNLLYGDLTEYASFQAYAFRRYFDEFDLFKLQDILLKKQQKLLKS